MSLAGSVRDVGKVAIEGAKDLRGIIALSALTLAGLGSLAVAKTTVSEPVADNADKFILNETIKTSLAKSRQDNEALRRAKKFEQLMKSRSLPHDKFI